MLLLLPAVFSQNKLFQKSYFSKTITVSPDLGPDCFQRLSGEDKSGH